MEPPQRRLKWCWDAGVQAEPGGSCIFKLGSLWRSVTSSPMYTLWISSSGRRSLSSELAPGRSLRLPGRHGPLDDTHGLLVGDHGPHPRRLAVGAGVAVIVDVEVVPLGHGLLHGVGLPDVAQNGVGKNHLPPWPAPCSQGCPGSSSHSSCEGHCLEQLGLHIRVHHVGSLQSHAPIIWPTLTDRLAAPGLFKGHSGSLRQCPFFLHALQ